MAEYRKIRYMHDEELKLVNGGRLGPMKWLTFETCTVCQCTVGVLNAKKDVAFVCEACRKAPKNDTIVVYENGASGSW